MLYCFLKKPRKKIRLNENETYKYVQMPNQTEEPIGLIWFGVVQIWFGLVLKYWNRLNWLGSTSSSNQTAWHLYST